MNEIVNRFLLIGDKFMPEFMPEFITFKTTRIYLIALVDHLQNIVKGFKNLKKQVI